MTKSVFITFLISAAICMSCISKQVNTESGNTAAEQTLADNQSKHLKPFKPELPTIGLLMYDGVLQSEVIATSDVFAKFSEDGKQRFNVVSIAQTQEAITTEEGMHFVPDYTFEDCPKLTALFVPSAYDMYTQVHNKSIVGFIKEKNEEVEYVVSNCAGAQLIGESGIADGKKIVTWIGGGTQLQKDYPSVDLKLQI